MAVRQNGAKALKTLGERLNLLMTSKGLTNAAMARLCDVSRQSVIHWRTPRFKRMDASLALIICDEFKVNLRWLIKGEGEMTGVGDLDINPEKLAEALILLDAHMQDRAVRLSADKKARAAAIIYQLMSSGVVADTTEPAVIKNVLRLVA